MVPKNAETCSTLDVEQMEQMQALEQREQQVSYMFGHLKEMQAHCEEMERLAQPCSELIDLQHEVEQLSKSRDQMLEVRRSASEYYEQVKHEADSFYAMYDVNLKKLKQVQENIERARLGVASQLIFFFVDIQETATRGYIVQSLKPSPDIIVITCVSGGENLNVMDFPVFKIFRITAQKNGLEVFNVCENDIWTGTHLRLRKYREKLEEYLDDDKTLFMISDGSDVFFNDITPILKENETFSTILRRRFDKFNKDIVISSERLCGWGGAFLCSREEANRFPDDPETSSKFLNAGGYVGKAIHLHAMITEVTRIRKSQCDHDPDDRYCGGPGGEADQYFFMKYYWNHQDTVTLDTKHTIFGNFLEVGQHPCLNGWKPRCAFEPCCTESDVIHDFNVTYNQRYFTEMCTVRRHDNIPLTWHGNGVGKWFFFISLERMVKNCKHIAYEMWSMMNLQNMYNVIDQLEKNQHRRWDDSQK